MSTPILQHDTETGSAAAMQIALQFDTAMAAGHGTVYITDGALQDVIDRATGMPMLQVVGATSTVKLDATQLAIDGATVTLAVKGLLPGHAYSVVMDSGVLVGSDGAAFGGIRATSQLQFTTAPVAITPALLHYDADGSLLNVGGSIALTLTFSEAVPNLTAAALRAPNARVTDLSSSDGGITWHAMLQAPPNAVTAAANTLQLDLGRVVDAVGHAGSGMQDLLAYRVDTRPPTATVSLDGSSLTATHDLVATLQFSEAVSGVDKALAAGHAGITDVHSIDGGLTWLATLSGQAATTAQGDVLALDMTQVHDLAGNAGNGIRTSGVYTVDTQAPAVLAIALDGTTLGGANGTRVTFTFSEAVQDLPLAAIVAPHASVSDLHSVDGITWTAQLAAAGQGTWTANTLSLDLTQIHDLAGNAGSGVASSGNYVVDTVVGAAVATLALIDHGPSASDGVTNANIQFYTGTLTEPLRAGQSVVLTVDGNVVGTAAVLDDPLHWAFNDDRLLGDGAHTVSAQVVDSAGHASAALATAVTIDTVAPDLAGSNAGASFEPGSDIVLTFSEAVYWNAADGSGGLQLATAGGATRVLALDEGNFSNGHTTLTLAAAALDLAPGADYTLFFSDGLSDLAGNAVSAPGIDIHTVGAADTTPPSAWSVTPDTGSGTYGVGASIEFTVQFSEAVHLLGAAPVLQLNNGGRAVLVSASDDGQQLLFRYTVAAGDGATDSLDLAGNSDLVGHIADSAGNVLDPSHVDYAYLTQEGHIAIDPTPDAPPDGLSAPALAFEADSGIKGDGITSDAAPTLAGSGATPFAHLAVLADGAAIGTVDADAGGNWTWSETPALAPGTYSLNAAAIDGAGQPANPSPAFALTIIAPPPLAAALTPDSDSGVPGDGLTNVTRPTLTGSAEAGTTIALFEGDVALGGAVTDDSGTWTFTLPADLADGAHTITLSARDNLGRDTPSSASTPLVFTIDTRAPEAPGRPVLAASSDSGVSHGDGITNVATPTLNGSAATSSYEPNSTIEVYDGTRLLGSTAVAASGSWTFTVPADAPLADGAHTLTARHVDAAGNRSAASAPLTVVIDTIAPIVTSTHTFIKASQNWIALDFDEAIVFNGGGTLDVLDGANRQQAHYTDDVRTNWDIAMGAAGAAGTDSAAGVLELRLGSVAGTLHLADNGTIQDLAGNVALIGTATLPGSAP